MAKRNYAEERRIEQELKQETSLDATIGQLANFLNGGSPMPDTSRSSAGRGRSSGDDDGYPTGLDKPEPFHVDAEGLMSKLGGMRPQMQYGLPIPPQQPQASGPAEAEYTVSQSGNLVLRRKTASAQMPMMMPQMAHPMAPQYPGFYQPQFAFSAQDANDVLGELAGFSFSPEHKEYEIETIKTALRDALTKLKTQRVAQNTKSLSKNAEKFTKTSRGGIRGIFSVLGVKISMKVEGEFSGDETLHLSVEGDKAIGLVLRKDPYGRFVDASDQFEIAIERYESD